MDFTIIKEKCKIKKKWTPILMFGERHFAALYSTESRLFLTENSLLTSCRVSGYTRCIGISQQPRHFLVPFES